MITDARKRCSFYGNSLLESLTTQPTLHGTVWGLPILLPQYPLLTGMTDNLAKMMAPLIAVATSLEHFTPKPT